ncbi:MAG: RNA-binding S4 domain-containing protein [Bacteroidales bacterium]
MKIGNSSMRADKWLWSVRIYKTRGEAAEACKNGRIKIDKIAIKAARSLGIGDIIVVRKSPVNYLYRVLDFPISRINASLATKYCENLTEQKELDKLYVNKTVFFAYRKSGEGRPTKRDRRKIEEIFNYSN